MVTIIAVTQGEETFIDSNGNGIFDGPQEFNPSDPSSTPQSPSSITLSSAMGSPFQLHAQLIPSIRPFFPATIDSIPPTAFELFFDSDGDGTWDQPNGRWDANKPIFAATTVLFTGPTQLSVGVLQADGSCSGNPSGSTYQMEVPPRPSASWLGTLRVDRWLVALKFV